MVLSVPGLRLDALAEELFPSPHQWWQVREARLMDHRFCFAVFVIDVSPGFSYLTGLLNRMTNPAIAAATLFIRCVQNNRPAPERHLSSLCH